MLSALALMLCAGCPGQGQMPGKTPPPPSSRIDKIVVQSAPTAVNWDQRPGPDGLVVSVHLFNDSSDLPVLGKGTMEFKLYEGTLGEGQLAEAKPLMEWRYSGSLLANCVFRSPIGWGYGMQLGWGSNAPKTESVTLTATYAPPTGPAIAAKPIVIPVGAS